ncbi:MAG TPA: efflux RND transporter periplasmic adaptor subunit [Thermoanaerobaculia bacterium]|nr:efflux RND transporter periplasmic adaptor subunit [Thermoanaerobaculia bacterium]
MAPRVLLLLVLLLAPVLSGCGDPEAPEETAAAAPAAPPPPAPPSSTAPEKPWLGVVLASESVDVTADSQGRLSAVYAQIGDTVRKGDRLASLDPRIVAQDLEMARSALRASEADAGRVSAELSEAQARWDRRRKNPEIFSKEDLSESELRVTTARSSVEVAQARVQEQRARVRQLETSVGQTEIRAPFDGRVAERFADPGAQVGPGTPVVRLMSGGDLRVRAAVPPDDARKLSPGTPVIARVRDVGLDVPGRVERIAPAVDTASQMVFVEIRLDPSPQVMARLQAGLVVDVRPSTSAPSPAP